MGAALQLTHHTEGPLPRELLGTVRCRGRAFQVCTGLIMGCLGQEAEVEKGKDRGDLGRNTHRKVEE